MEWDPDSHGTIPIPVGSAPDPPDSHGMIPILLGSTPAPSGFPWDHPNPCGMDSIPSRFPWNDPDPTGINPIPSRFPWDHPNSCGIDSIPSGFPWHHPNPCGINSSPSRFPWDDPNPTGISPIPSRSLVPDAGAGRSRREIPELGRHLRILSGAFLPAQLRGGNPRGTHGIPGGKTSGMFRDFPVGKAGILPFWSRKSRWDLAPAGIPRGDPKGKSLGGKIREDFQGKGFWEFLGWVFWDIPDGFPQILDFRMGFFG